MYYIGGVGVSGGGGGEDCHVFTAVFVCLFGGLVNCVKFVIVGGGVSDWNRSDATADTTMQQEICAPACPLPYIVHIDFHQPQKLQEMLNIRSKTLTLLGKVA